MSTSLLVTKLYRPSVRARLVPRARLYERLDAGLARRLILVSAPAGYGKSTLLSVWTQQLGQREEPIPVAWLSLDSEDNDPAQFLSYLFCALQTLYGDVGLNAQAALDVHPLPPVEPLIIALINDIAERPAQGLLVLDDYHAVTNQGIHEALDFFLDHLPPQLHLVISTRADPPLGLDRLRVRGHLTEIRQADLAFTEAETSAFLHEVMGVTLSPENVTTLSARTEGWIAGLQLAALSLQHRDAAEQQRFVAAFGGTHRRVADYLLGEVYDRQPQPLQRFLLGTSILERLSGPLCDGVFPQDSPPHAQEVLEELERAGLFLVPLDHARRWYRYHHLWRDFLRDRAQREEPEQIPHRRVRASAWCEAHGLEDEAIEHALAAQDYRRAARLLERIGPRLIREMAYHRLRQWIDRLPRSELPSFPLLCVCLAWALVEAEDYTRVERILQMAEANSARAPEMPIQAYVAALRAGMRFWSGDVDGAVRLGLDALEVLEGASPYPTTLQMQSYLHLTLAHTYMAFGDPDRVIRGCRQAIELGRQAGGGSDVGRPSWLLVATYQDQGRLGQALEAAQRGLEMSREWASAHGRRGVPLTGDNILHVTMALTLYEMNRLDEARTHAETAVALSEMEGLLLTGKRWRYHTLALIDIAQGRYEDVFRALQRLSGAAPKPSPWVLLVTDSLMIDLRLRLSYLRPAWRYLLDEVAEWVADHYHGPEDGLGAQSGSGAWHVYDVVSQAFVASGGAAEALPIVVPRIERWREVGWHGRALRFLVTQALAYEALGQGTRARQALGQALALGQQGGYFRTFLERGESLQPLLSDLLEIKRAGDNTLAPGVSPAYIETLLMAFPLPDGAQRPPDSSGAATIPSSPPVAALIEPLTDRERDVLRLMSRGLRNQDIAQALYVSINTVRFHAKNIYSKLLVKNRAEAVARAALLRLL